MTIPTSKETPEEMEKRLRAKIHAEEPVDIPPSLDPSNTGKVKKGNSSDSFGMKTWAMVAIVALIISFLVVEFVGVSPINKNVTTVNTKVTSAQADIKSLQTSLSSVSGTEANNQSTLTALQNAINDTNNKITSINEQISSLQGSVSSLTGKSYVTTAQLSGFVSSDQLNTANNTIVALQATLKTLQTQLATDEANLAADQTAIKALQTTATTTPTTSTTTNTGTTTNGITVSIANNPYWGKPIVMFSTPIVPLSNTNAVNSATQYFTFQLTNNGKTAINNQQLAIGLSIYNVAGTAPYSLPPDTTANSIMLSSVGLGTTWTNQGYVQPNVIGYENTVTSGVFSVLGQITLVAGQTVTINMSVTATAGGTNTIQPFLMYIQVIPIPSS